jgi:hypothetical protein
MLRAGMGYATMHRRRAAPRMREISRGAALAGALRARHTPSSRTSNRRLRTYGICLKPYARCDEREIVDRALPAPAATVVRAAGVGALFRTLMRISFAVKRGAASAFRRINGINGGGSEEMARKWHQRQSMKAA